MSEIWDCPLHPSFSRVPTLAAGIKSVPFPDLAAATATSAGNVTEMSKTPDRDLRKVLPLYICPGIKRILDTQ